MNVNIERVQDLRSVIWIPHLGNGLQIYCMEYWWHNHWFSPQPFLPSAIRRIGRGQTNQINPDGTKTKLLLIFFLSVYIYSGGHTSTAVETFPMYCVSSIIYWYNKQFINEENNNTKNFFLKLYQKRLAHDEEVNRRRQGSLPRNSNVKCRQVFTTRKNLLTIFFC